MKTFFIALILGIFIGSIATNYFSSPDSFAKLKNAKEEMLIRPGFEDGDPAPALEEAPPEARFEVADDELLSDPLEETEEPSAPPISAPETEEEPNQEEGPLPQSLSEEKEAPATSPKNEPPPAEPEANESDPVDRLFEEGSEKAEEIAETTKEKAKEVAKKAEPLIEDGIDLGIATAIRAQFKLEKRLQTSDIEIDVTNRHVVLRGSVPSKEAKRVAVEIAVFTKGVEGVEEELAITP